MTKYEAVIGLEVHVQLQTASKLFCGCSTRFGAVPNSQVCPVCLGLPGVLPVLNRRALELAVRAGLALGCQISAFSKFDRKNYFYPDLPKAYQISQYDKPVTYKGKLSFVVDGKVKEVGVTRAHLEEDAGKLLHAEDGGDSLVDYNRCGVPLLEIVSEPDLRSSQEAYEYLKALKSILQYLEVSECDMEKGSLRCDANVSIRPAGSEKFGTKAEIKNLNSFRFVQKALDHEMERQAKALEAGERVVQETRLWDPDKAVTRSMRSKEEAHDYRYFPDPDLVPMVVPQKWIEEIRATLPELPLARKARFIQQYGIPEYDAGVLTAEKPMADFFETCVLEYKNPKIVSNWIMVELTAKFNETGETIETCKISAPQLAALLKLIDDGTISGKIAKDVFAGMFQTGKEPSAIVQEKGLVQIADAAFLEEVIERVLSKNKKSADDFRAGKTAALGFLVGQVMKETQGKANPKLVNEILGKKLQLK